MKASNLSGIFFLLLCALLLNRITAQSGNLLQYQSQFGETEEYYWAISNDVCRGNDLVIAPDDYIYVAGYDAVADRPCLMKISKDGKVAWIKRYHTNQSSDHSDFKAIEITNQGFIVAGFYGNRLWLANLNFDGQVIPGMVWYFDAGTAGFSEYVRLERTRDNCYIIGSSTDRADGLKDQIIRLMKVNGLGEILWQKTYSLNNDLLHSVSSIFEPEQGNYLIITGNVVPTWSSSWRGIILKIDPQSGDLIWGKVTDQASYRFNHAQNTLTELINGDLILLGNPAPGNGTGFITKLNPEDGIFDNNISKIISLPPYYLGTENLRSIHALPDGGFLVQGGIDDPSSENDHLWIIKFSSDALIEYERIYQVRTTVRTSMDLDNYGNAFLISSEEMYKVNPNGLIPGCPKISSKVTDYSNISFQFNDLIEGETIFILDTNTLVGTIFFDGGEINFTQNYSCYATDKNCGDSWNADYFTDAGSPLESRCESRGDSQYWGINTIDYFWGKSKPNIENLPIDNFSVIWHRIVDFPVSGFYRFRTLNDDGIRLFIDGQIQIDDWKSHSFDEASTTEYLIAGSHDIALAYYEETGDALVNLNWYYCLNSEDCEMNIPSQYQTNFPLEPMPLTANPEVCPDPYDLDPYDNDEGILNNNIGGVGCKITSIAMALEKEINRALEQTNIKINPKDLNDYLSIVNEGETDPIGYRDKCSGHVDPIRYQQILNFASERYSVNLKYISTHIDIQQAILEGHPVILKVPNGFGGDHFVLGVDNTQVLDQNNDIKSTIGINDPHHAWNCWIAPLPNQAPLGTLSCSGLTNQHKTLLLQYSSYQPVLYFEVDEGERTDSLQAIAENAEILIINQQGEKTGFDPATGLTLNQIEGAFYMNAFISPPGVETDNKIARTLFLSNAPKGQYKLFIFPHNYPDSYSNDLSNQNSQVPIVLDVFGYDVNNNFVEQSIHDPQFISYIIDYDPGISINITENRVYYYLPLVGNFNYP